MHEDDIVDLQRVPFRGGGAAPSIDTPLHASWTRRTSTIST
jgi:hypothetical protein